MSIEAVGRTLRAPLGGNAKVILLGIANHAHYDGSNAYPAVETLAEYAHCDRRTAQRNIRKLESDGLIEREGVGPMGQARWRVRFETWEQGGRQNATGGIEGSGGAAPVPPEPSIGTVQRSENAHDAREQLPDDFPDDLKPHAREVFRILRAVAEQHGARKVWPLAVGRAVVAYPRRPLVETAHDVAGWATDPPRPVRDVVSTYRTFLKGARDLEAPERLDGSTPAQPANVRPIRTGNAAEDARRARQAKRFDALGIKMEGINA